MDPIATLQESTPNGFHDGSLYELRIDYSGRRMVLDVGLDMSEGGGARRAKERRCKIVIMGLEFVIIESVEGFSRSKGEDGVMIDVGPLEGERLRRVWKRDAPSDGFVYWMFVSESDGCIYFCGRDGLFEWSD